MKSNFIDKLGITNLDSSVISLYSTFGIGKTTLLAVVASEFYHDGKNVLFLSQDEDEKTIIKKVRKALVGTKPIGLWMFMEQFLNLITNMVTRQAIFILWQKKHCSLLANYQIFV